MTPILAFELWEAVSPFLTLGVQVIDLALVGLIVFYVYRLTKGTSAIPVFLGLLAIYLIWKLVTLMGCLLYTSPSPRDATLSRMPSSA